MKLRRKSPTLHPQLDRASRKQAALADARVKREGGRLGDLLVEAQLVAPDQVDAALAETRDASGKRIGSVLIAEGIIDEATLAHAVADAFELEFIDLRQITPDKKATALLTESMARSLFAVPVSIDEDTVVVAVADPSPSILSALKDAIDRPVQVKVGTESGVLMAMGSSYRAIAAVGSQVSAFQATEIQKDVESLTATATTIANAPVVQIVQLLITQGLRDRASDIHIEPQGDRVRVRYRIDGALQDVLDLPGGLGPPVISRLKIMAGLNIIERRRPQDGQISTEVEGRSVDIRVATTSVTSGEKVVMRLLDKSRPLYRLGDLGMPPEMAARYTKLLHSPYGMVICAGPTGSGKTTTLYGSLAEINTPERNIMTIEDPVEYRILMTNQIQINEQAGVTFAGGLKSILRQDPDVILVGEIRDIETARIAVQSALTGHFVLSSLHATDTASALQRFLDMGIESFLVAASISAVLSQRLVRKVCVHCRESYQPTTAELELLHEMGGQPPRNGFVKGAGCNFCVRTGYLGRVGIYEMLSVTNAVRELIVERAPHAEIRRVASSEGMITLREESMRLIANGVSDIPEIMRTVYVVGG